MDPTLRDLDVTSLDVTVGYVSIPIPERPEMEEMIPSQHFGSEENVTIIWNNIQRMRKYIADLEGALEAYRSQASTGDEE